MQQQENIAVRKRWDVTDIPVQLDNNCTWGIPGQYVPAIMESLVALNLVAKEEVVAGKLTFNQFRIFVSHLHQNGYNTNELQTAVEKWRNDENKSKQPEKFNEKWILVVGTGNDNVTKEQLWVAGALGTSLADAGYGLISGGWPYVDQAVTEAFNNRLVAAGTAVNDRLLQIITERQKPVYEYGERITVKNDKEWNRYAIGKAAAVVMIGGEGGTYSIAVDARSAGVPVIPIHSTGGDALKLYKETMGVLESSQIKPLGDLKTTIESEPDAEKAAAVVTGILNDIPAKGNSGSMSR